MKEFIPAVYACRNRQSRAVVMTIEGRAMRPLSRFPQIARRFSRSPELKGICFLLSRKLHLGAKHYPGTDNIERKTIFLPQIPRNPARLTVQILG
ncbi:hypothetical protein [Psychromarinibacter sp. S121]|uniref:hypothetical protein n=1 Tax=Psychromarinibacter sp. S121 TaxID=3415127 RepID=UPI003C79BB90